VASQKTGKMSHFDRADFSRPEKLILRAKDRPTN
jgi:hypothetical protein